MLASYKDPVEIVAKVSLVWPSCIRISTVVGVAVIMVVEVVVIVVVITVIAFVMEVVVV